MECLKRLGEGIVLISTQEQRRAQTVPQCVLPSGPTACTPASRWPPICLLLLLPHSIPRGKVVVTDRLRDRLSRAATGGLSNQRGKRYGNGLHAAVMLCCAALRCAVPGSAGPKKA